MAQYIDHLNRGMESDTASSTLLRSALAGSFTEADLTHQRHIWHIDDFLRCPVIGTCLFMQEQKQILKRAGVQTKTMNEHEIHSQLVQCAGSENRIAIRTETTLNRKYRAEMRAFDRLALNELPAEWKTRFAAGEHAALLWHMATRPGVPEEHIRMLFADVHMQMHECAERNRRDRRLLQQTEAENRKLMQQLRELKQSQRDTAKATRRFADELAQSRRYCAELQQQLLRDMGSGRSQRDTELEELARDNEAMRSELAGLVESIARLQRAYEALRSGGSAGPQQPSCREGDRMSGCDTGAAAACPAGGPCPHCDLCRCRVLIVGGITKLEVLYRKAVEASGASFDYHDGYMQSGGSALEKKVRRADLVLCPVNCNSHGACLLAKRLGKKYRKQVRMISGSSLSAVAQTLWKHARDMAEGQSATH
jgi:hypothetical protein